MAIATVSRAAVVRGPETGVEILETMVDPPGPGEVRIRTVAAGVCGSDRHVVHGQTLRGVYPVVLGHECAGVVESVGDTVDSVRPGDHVVVAIGGACGRCARCVRGEAMLCEGAGRSRRLAGRMSDGAARVHCDGVELHPYVGCGALAELVVVPAHEVVRIPSDVPFEVAALTGCGVTTGLGAVFNVADVRVGATVLVIGCGGVGLNVVQGCRLAGASEIIAADTDPRKLDLARALGATTVVDTSSAELAPAVRAVLPAGVDVAFEVVGRPELVTEAFELTRPGGACVAVGLCPPGSRYSIDAAQLNWQRRLLGVLAGGLVGPHGWITPALELYRTGRLDLDPLVGVRLPLDRAAEALDPPASQAIGRAMITFG